MGFSASVKEIAQQLSAEIRGLNFTGEQEYSAFYCRGVETDSRLVREGNLFIARKGELSDGHLYLDQAKANGARVFIVAKQWVADGGLDRFASNLKLPGEVKEMIFLVVEDPTRALGELAKNWRTKLNIPTVAITGSNGKTTVKEITKTILSNLIGSGNASEKSYNNHVGLPQTILATGLDAKWLVLEAGMNHSGELDYLGQIARPDVGVVLNVGPVHLEFFSTLSRIADAKCELLAHVKEQGQLIVNADDPEVLSGVKRLENKLSRRLSLQTFGLSAESVFQATDCFDLGQEGIQFKLNYQGQSLEVKAPILGLHNVSNLLAAMAIVKSLFPNLTLELIVSSVVKIIPAPMRLQMIELPGVLLLNDAYNANPISMAAGIKTAASLAGGRPLIFVLGDMLELGEKSAELHTQVGKLVAEVGSCCLVALGQQSQQLIAGAKAAGLKQVFVVSSTAEAVDIVLRELPKEKTVILVKGSRGMALENVVNGITKRLNALSSSI